MAFARTLVGALGAALLVALVWTAPVEAGQSCGNVGQIQSDTNQGVSNFVFGSCGLTCRLGCQTFATSCIGLSTGALGCQNQLVLRDAGDERAGCFGSSDPKERSDCILDAVLNALDRLNTGSSFAEVVGFCIEKLRSGEGTDCRDCESCDRS